jgi:cation transport regulator ChaC
MKHDDPTPTPERPVPPIYADDETVQAHMNDAGLVLAVYAGLLTVLNREVRSKHDVTRLFMVAAAVGDIGSIRQCDAGFGEDGFVELARNAWLKVEEIRQRTGESYVKNKKKDATVGREVDATVAALIEKQLGLSGDTKDS